MLEILKDLPEGVVGFRAEGRVNKSDYDAVMGPLLYEARREGRRIRMLYHFPPAFESFTASGAWEDARIGLQYLRLFDRCAIVTDIVWLRDSTRIFGSMMPCPVRVFPDSQWDEAVAWLSSPVAGSRVSHRLVPDAGVLIVEPRGALRAEDFDAIALTIDPWIEDRGELNGLVIYARAFPGWENLAGFLRHLHFVREHHRKIRRVAVCVDGTLAKILPKLGEYFVDAELQRFAYEQLDEAVVWAGQ